MKTPPKPKSEVQRLEELKALCILDTRPEPFYDDIAFLASQVAQTPIALISLVDEHRQWIKSRVGLQATETIRDISFCGHAILQRSPMIVFDASLDERFVDNPLVLGSPFIRFYAGFPLVTSSDHQIGTLCVIDTAPRELTAEQVRILSALSRLVVDQLEARKKNQDLKERILEACGASETLARKEWSIRRLYEITSAPKLSLDDKIRNLLRLGNEFLGLPAGVLSKIENDVCHIVNSETPLPQFQKGKTFPFADSLSQATVLSSEPVCFENILESDFRSHPARTKMNIQAYIGASILVDGVVYGTLNFFGFDAKTRSYGADEKRFIQLMAQWIGLELTRLRHLEKIEFQQKTMMYSSKMAALGEMAGGIAHEINNPLAMISGRSQLLRVMAENQTLTEASVLATAEKIDQTVSRILKVINGLRDFSRNSENVEFESTSVRQIVDDSLEFCIARLRNEGVIFHRSEIPEDLQIECRPVQISEVLLNLLNNSADAIQGREQRWIELKCEDHGDWVHFRIRDSGAGIPLDLRQKIMQPFFTTKEVGKGTGLGLSISLGLVNGHHGQLVLDENDKNTCFVVKLPKSQSSSMRKAQ